MRAVAVLLGAFTLAVLLPLVGQSARTRWRHGVASYYGTAGTSGGCHGLRRNGARTFASKDWIVPCGAHVRFCWHRRCVSGKRTDTGPNRPYTYSRQFDLSDSMARVLRMTGPGVVTLRWRRVK